MVRNARRRQENSGWHTREGVRPRARRLTLTVQGGLPSDRVSQPPAPTPWNIGHLHRRGDRASPHPLPLPPRRAAQHRRARAGPSPTAESRRARHAAAHSVAGCSARCAAQTTFGIAAWPRHAPVERGASAPPPLRRSHRPHGRAPSAPARSTRRRWRTSGSAAAEAAAPAAAAGGRRPTATADGARRFPLRSRATASAQAAAAARPPSQARVQRPCRRSVAERRRADHTRVGYAPPPAAAAAAAARNWRAETVV